MTATCPSVFRDHAATIARAILGDPNSKQSSKTELRFGTHGSLSVVIAGDRKGTWHDHEQGGGGGMLDLIRRERACDTPAALDYARSIGVPLDPPKPLKGGRIVASYDYFDADGALLFQVVRKEPKQFLQRKPDPAGQGGWTYKLGDTPRVLYRLPELVQADAGEVVFLVEGEKDADRLRALGLVATCNPGGASQPGQRSKWRPEFNTALAARHVAIVPDNDASGEAHASAVANSLIAARDTPATVRIIRLSGLPDKGDVSDWIGAGGTVDQLRAMVDAAPLYTTLSNPIAALRAEVAPASAETADTIDPHAWLLNEDSLALAFATAHRDRLRYCHNALSWYRWGGSIWERDERGLGFTMAREICRKAGEHLPPADSTRTTLAKRSTAGAVETMASRDRHFAVGANDWDRDPWLLGTPAGTVDLRTGELRKSDPADLITKRTAVTPAPAGTPHPIWTAFLQQATGATEANPAGDAELQRFLQRLIGYCLTGDVSEEVLAFLYGDGGTGKGTFIGTIAAIMGDYAVSVPIEVFTAGSRLNLEYYRARMAGARMVTASETEGGASWAESQIKELTGNETPLSARQPYGKAFEYRPTFKITLVGNHAPQLKNRSQAMERRLRIVPFKHKPAVADYTLKERLRAEYPAILRWAIEGALAWQRDRLGTAAAVTAESRAYFEQQDHFGRWIEERCRTGSGLSEKPSRLLADFLAWARENNEAALTSGEFREMIERAKGLSYKRSGGIQRVEGIGLAPDEQAIAAERARYGER